MFTSKVNRLGALRMSFHVDVLLVLTQGLGGVRCFTRRGLDIGTGADAFRKAPGFEAVALVCTVDAGSVAWCCFLARGLGTDAFMPGLEAVTFVCRLDAGRVRRCFLAIGLGSEGVECDGPPFRPR